VETIGATGLDFGDGAFTNTLNFRVTAYDVDGNWILARALQPGTANENLIHTYATPLNLSGKPWLARISSCCRIGNLRNSSDGSYNVETLIRFDIVNSSPVSGLTAVVNVPINTNFSFPVAALDADGDKLTWRLSDPNESGISDPIGPAGGIDAANAPTINSSNGVLSWNTTGGTFQNDLFTIQVTIEESRNNIVIGKVAVDFIFLVVGSSGYAPECKITPDGPFVATVGRPITFTVQGTDSDSDDIVTINSGGLPSGATMNPSLPTSGASGISSTFRWTPGIGQDGAYTINYTVTDITGQQALCPVLINTSAGANTAYVSGHVFGAFDGESLMSLSNVAVKLIQGSDILYNTTTDPNGVYAFASIPSGAYSIEYSKRGYVSLTTPSINLQGYSNLGHTVLLRNIKPAKPVITAVRDAGTGHDLIVEWTQGPRLGISAYQVYFGNSSGDYIFRSNPIQENGSNKYSFMLSNLQYMKPHYVAVRSYSRALDLWSEYATITPNDTANYPSIPIVLVHGWRSAGSTWNTMDDWLAQDHFNHRWIIDIDPCGGEGERLFDKNSKKLSVGIETLRNNLLQTNGIIPASVMIVAHSMGGMVARRYATGDDSWSAHSKGLKVETLIMLGTPNGGVPLATHLLETSTERCSHRLPGIPAWDCLNAGISHGLGALVCNGPADDEFAEGQILQFNSSPHHNAYRSDVRLVGIAGVQNPPFRIVPKPNDGFIAMESVLQARLTIPGQPERDLLDKAYSYGPIELPLGAVIPGYLHTRLTSAEDIYLVMVRPELLRQSVSQSFRIDLSQAMSPNTSSTDFSYAFSDSIVGLTSVSREFNVWGSSQLALSAFGFGGGLHFGLISPNGTVYDSTIISTPALSYGTMYDLTEIVIPDPLPGNWRVIINADSLLAPAWPYFVSVHVEDSVSVDFLAQPASLALGDTLLLSCKISTNSLAAPDALVSCIGYSDSAQEVLNLSLTDAGVHGDLVAADGNYAAQWVPDDSLGVITLVIQAVGRDSAFLKTGLLFTRVDPRGCCVAASGNVDCDQADVADISDLTALIDHLFINRTQLCCAEEANTDGSPDGVADVSDLTALIDHLFISLAPTAACQ